MSSSAVDSQLATARSQLRFQSAAFSSSLQIATQAILDQKKRKRKCVCIHRYTHTHRTEEENKNMKEQERD